MVIWGFWSSLGPAAQRERSVKYLEGSKGQSGSSLASWKFKGSHLGHWEEPPVGSVRGFLGQPRGWPHKNKCRDVVRESGGVICMPKPSFFLPRRELRVKGQHSWHGSIEMGTSSHSKGPIMPVRAEVTLASQGITGTWLSWELVKTKTYTSCSLSYSP